MNAVASRCIPPSLRLPLCGALAPQQALGYHLGLSEVISGSVLSPTPQTHLSSSLSDPLSGVPRWHFQSSSELSSPAPPPRGPSPSSVIDAHMSPAAKARSWESSWILPCLLRAATNQVLPPPPPKWSFNLATAPQPGSSPAHVTRTKVQLPTHSPGTCFVSCKPHCGQQGPPKQGISMALPCLNNPQGFL